MLFCYILNYYNVFYRFSKHQILRQLKNWLELEIEPPTANLAYPNRWNTLYLNGLGLIFRRAWWGRRWSTISPFSCWLLIERLERLDEVVHRPTRSQTSSTSWNPCIWTSSPIHSKHKDEKNVTYVSRGSARDRDLYKLGSCGKFVNEFFFVSFIKHHLTLGHHALGGFVCSCLNCFWQSQRSLKQDRF